MPDVERKRSKSIFLLVRIAVVALGLILGGLWLAREQRWHRLIEIFGQMNMGVFVCALLIFIVGQVLIGLRWWLLLRAQSILIGFWVAVRLYFLGWFYNNFMPGSVGGDLLRAWYVTKHTDRKFEAALSVFVDRIIGLLSTLTIAAFFYLVFLRGKGIVLTSSGQGRILRFAVGHKTIVLSTVLALAVALCGLLLYGRSRPMMTRAWSHIYLWAKRGVIRFKQAVLAYCSKPLAILMAFALTVFLQMLTITAFWFVGIDIGIGAGIKYYYVFFALTWVLGAVPVSVAGAVVVESLLAYLFIEFAGVEPEAALAIALCQRLVWMLASLPGAVIHLMGAHLPKDFFIDCKAPMS
jgi:hypothetical protein